MSLKSGHCKQNSVNLLCIRGWKKPLKSWRNKIKTLYLATYDQGQGRHFFSFGWTDLVRPQYKWGPRWLNEAASTVYSWSKNMQAPGPWQKATPLKSSLLFARVWWVRVCSQQSRHCVFLVSSCWSINNAGFIFFFFFHANSEHSPHCAAGNKEWSYLVYTQMPVSHMEICWQK